ncbi:MAG: sigma-70 family RNA polymerase sigma factor [Bacteroidota bacterium]
MRELIRSYQREKENPVALELLNRYRTSSNQERGEIIWGLLAPHRTDLSRIVASLNENPEDELQNLYIKLHGLFLRGKFPEKNWKHWLARILKNDMLNKKTKKNPIVSVPVERLPEAEAAPTEAPLNMNLLQKAVDKLPANQKRVVELRYLKRSEKLMTYKEIAATMQVSVGQVHGYLDRAKENLRIHLHGIKES